MPRASFAAVLLRLSSWGFLSSWGLLSSCGDVGDLVQGETGMRVAEPLPAIELSGRLVGHQEEYEASYSIPRDRFRLERRGRAYIGSMSDPGWLLALDLETKTWIRYERDRYRDLDRAGRHAEASRYRHACSSLGASERIPKLAMAPFLHPCELAKAALSSHTECEHSSEGGGRERWTHRVSNLQGEFIAHEKVTRTVVHVYDTRRGVVVDSKYGSSNSNSTSRSGVILSGARERPLQAVLFEVPPDYRELMIAGELARTTRPHLGWEQMVPARTLRLASVHSEDSPGAPAPARWSIVRERWIDHSREPKVEVHVDSAVPAVAKPLQEIPQKVLYGLGFETAWELETVAGDRSRRLDERRLLFTVDGALVKVLVHPEGLAADRLTPLCQELARRMTR